MNKLAAGVVAGLIATVVLSILMVIKGMMGVMPDLNVITMLAVTMETGAATGWVAHFLIGIGYGVIFSRLSPGGSLAKATFHGIVLGSVGWAAMMILLMPMMGKGLFGAGMPSDMLLVPLATLMLHVIFGAVLGASHHALAKNPVRAGAWD
ncbi:hypothetical protein RA2_04446 [Roseovarius sp. A-2]|uniref:DUF6789 family protein n=1 Tax=Roseovarius sp. A-2 TaxID=1570360 RepID=UPI0009B4FC06|nr:DUF6789 family protein [Roseovarius sp. A-2]GAW37363.1 hypothetical protein RA2_04446 [Roseovarius sp. A-2]